MKIRKSILFFLCIVILVSLSISVGAASNTVDLMPITRTTNRFEMDISARTTAMASTSFSLDEGDVVSFNAAYTPTSASVDFGLVDSEGVFHYLTASGGVINRGIRITERGSYTFAVRNNSYSTINVSGYVYY